MMGTRNPFCKFIQAQAARSINEVPKPKVHLHPTVTLRYHLCIAVKALPQVAYIQFLQHQSKIQNIWNLMMAIPGKEVRAKQRVGRFIGDVSRSLIHVLKQKQFLADATIWGSLGSDTEAGHPETSKLLPNLVDRLRTQMEPTLNPLKSALAAEAAIAALETPMLYPIGSDGYLELRDINDQYAQFLLTAAETQFLKLPQHRHFESQVVTGK